MCEMLGSEPIESEIPVEIYDFPQEVQEAFSIYSLLSDNWEPMSGSYLGKTYSNVFDYFELFLVEKSNWLFMITLLQAIDSARSKVIAEKQKARQKEK
jgi:hypothetical protein